MKEIKFVLGNADLGTNIVCTSHDQDEFAALVEVNQAGCIKTLREFCKANDLGEDDIKDGIMYVPYDFYFDDEGAANYRGPDADHEFYDQERFVEAMEAFNDNTVKERGMENTDDAWINIGGTFCCGPCWKENPYYTGIPTANPNSAVH